MSVDLPLYKIVPFIYSANIFRSHNPTFTFLKVILAVESDDTYTESTKVSEFALFNTNKIIETSDRVFTLSILIATFL